MGEVRWTITPRFSRIALHRPLDKIADPAEQAAAERVRTWFGKEFRNALVD